MYIHMVMISVRVHSIPRFGVNVEEYQPTFLHIRYYEHFRTRFTFEMHPFKPVWYCPFGGPMQVLMPIMRTENETQFI